MHRIYADTAADPAPGTDTEGWEARPVIVRYPLVEATSRRPEPRWPRAGRIGFIVSASLIGWALAAGAIIAAVRWVATGT